MPNLRKPVAVLASIFVVALGLRLAFLHFTPTIDDDTDVYRELGTNFLQHHTYGMEADGEINPSLFRLPGYPLFLGVMSVLFGTHWRLATVLVQITADLLGAYLLGKLAARWHSRRAGQITFALAAVCPFTAVYAADPLTESLSIFAVSLTLSFGPAVYEKLRNNERPTHRQIVCLAAGPALAMILRPDGALLLFAVLLSVLFYSRRHVISTLQSTMLVALLALLPLLPWAVRNYKTFHVFQPLAPRHVNDPGERVNLGFYNWMRTWACEFNDTYRVYWQVGTHAIAIDDLPSRAIDSPEEHMLTASILTDYNRTNNVDAPLDARFQQLADLRIHAHPLRYYIVLPIVRIGDMLFRPRGETFGLGVDWWQYHAHPQETLFAAALLLINLFYVGAGLFGLLLRHSRPAWALPMVLYLLLRLALLGTMENAEPRYTLELFPIFFLCAGCLFARRRTAA